MSEMTDARERIHQEVYEAYQAGIDHECVPHKYPPMKQEDIAEIADAIIAIVREALLSEDAKRAVGSATESRYYNADGSLRGVAKGFPSTVITAALDAVFGDQQS